jgi:uroporphyrinogen decarboxylase
MRQAGRYLPEYRQLRATAGGFLKLCLDQGHAVEATLQPVHRFALDAAILFSDILIVPYALGVRIWFEDGEGPRLEPLTDRYGFSSLRNALRDEVVGPVYEAVRQARAALPPSVGLIGFCGGPWTVSTYLVAGRGTNDKAEAIALADSDVPLFTAMIERLADTSAQHLIGQLRAGADAVQIFDTWAGVLGDSGFERWCLAPTERMVARVRHAVPNARIILFPKGVALAQLERLVRVCRPHAVGLDASVDRLRARERLGSMTALQGNLDPLVLVEGGARLAREIDAIRNDFRGVRHVFNLGHGILPQTPIAHVEQMIAQVRGAC